MLPSQGKSWRCTEPAPTPADFGFDVTIGIVAITVPDDIIVCVSDRMISFGDITQAEDNATVKIHGIHPDWVTVFSADDINLVLPITEEVRARLVDSEYDMAAVQEIFGAVYVERVHQEFLSTRLVKYGYRTVDQFRTEGRGDLGDHFFELCRELDGFDLGVQFAVCGHDKQHRARLFEISSPGHIVDRNLLKYAVVGSGYHMATASLRRKPMKFHLESTIYRLLEAKFSAESATGVGKTTTVILKSRTNLSILADNAIQEIKRIWDDGIRTPDPKEATEYLASLSGVKLVIGENDH